MTYVQGGVIQASDYNGFQATTSSVYGVGTGDHGYGQSTITLPTVLGGHVQTIGSVEWTHLNDATQLCATHQGTTVSLPPDGELVGGHVKLVKASPPFTGNFPTSITAINTNRLIAAIGSTTLFTGLFTSSRGSSWVAVIATEFSATFASADAARYFFNSGGQIRINGSRTGGSSNAQNTRWTTFLSDIGSVLFCAHGTHHTGVYPHGYPIGYYELTGSYQKVYLATLPGHTYGYPSNKPYGGTPYNQLDEFIVLAKSNGVQGAHADNGTVITFKVILKNDYLAPTTIDGTTAINVDERRATTYLTGITGANYALITPL